MSDKERIGAETFELKRDKKMPNIGPGPIEYGTGQRFTNLRDAGTNLPFTQKIQDDATGDQSE